MRTVLQKGLQTLEGSFAKRKRVIHLLFERPVVDGAQKLELFEVRSERERERSRKSDESEYGAVIRQRQVPEW